MAFDINTVTVVGRLTRDGEFSYTQASNKALYRFSIANNSGRSDSDDSVSFFDVVAWEKTAEICNQYLSKGSQVVVQGRLTQRRFQDQQGQNRSRVEIVASSVQFIGSAGGKEGAREASPPPTSQVSPVDNSDFDDDIPF